MTQWPSCGVYYVGVWTAVCRSVSQITDVLSATSFPSGTTSSSRSFSSHCFSMSVCLSVCDTEQRNLSNLSARKLNIDCKKVLPYLLPSVGPGADDPGIQAVSPQVTFSHPLAGRLPVLSTQPAISFPAKEHHCPSASTKLYCLVTEAHGCEQLAQGCYSTARRPGPLSHQSDALATRLSSHQLKSQPLCCCITTCTLCQQKHTINLTLDLWPWLLTQGELGSWAIHTQRVKVQRSVGSRDRVKISR